MGQQLCLAHPPPALHDQQLGDAARHPTVEQRQLVDAVEESAADDLTGDYLAPANLARDIDRRLARARSLAATPSSAPTWLGGFNGSARCPIGLWRRIQDIAGTSWHRGPTCAI
jgi:hypothetical protein